METLHFDFSGDLPKAVANNNENWLWDHRAALVVLTNFWRTDKARMNSLPPCQQRAELQASHRSNLLMIQQTWELLGSSLSPPSQPSGKA